MAGAGGGEFGGAAVGEAGAAGVGAAVGGWGVGGGAAVGEEERSCGAADEVEREKASGAALPPEVGTGGGAGPTVDQVEVVGVEGEDRFDGRVAFVEQVPEGLFAERGADGEEGSQVLGGEGTGAGRGEREGAQVGGGVGVDPTLGAPPGDGRAQDGEFPVERAGIGVGCAAGDGAPEASGGVRVVEQREREDGGRARRRSGPTGALRSASAQAQVARAIR